MIYILKIKGTEKIPDFVQIRDENMSLIAYFRADQLDTGLKKYNLMSDINKLKNKIKEMPFGKIKKYKIS